MPAQLDLLVEAAEELEVAVRRYRTRSPVRYIGAPPAAAERIGDEPLGGELGPLQ